MSLGAITKQLAQEALGNQVKEMVDSLRGEASTQAPDISDNVAALVMQQVGAMQAALKDDQELLVHCTAAGVTLRVMELFAPSPKLLVITGQDAERGLARVITPADAIQLVCRPVAVKGDAKALRVRLITPKPKA
jgi:hypothetical protein